jgi:hypothetical protein
MKWTFLCLLGLSLLTYGVSVLTHAANNAAAGSESEASSEEEEGSDTSLPSFPPHKHNRGVKGPTITIVRCPSERIVKQCVSLWESEDELDKLLDPPVNPDNALTEAAKGVDPAPKGARRARYEFPENLRAAKADRPRFVKMSVPERLAPKKRTYTVAQGPARLSGIFVGFRMKVQAGVGHFLWR